MNTSAAWGVESTHVQEFCLGTSDTLLAAFDEHLIWRQQFAGSALPFRCLARESDLDLIFLLQSCDVLAILPDE